MNTLIAVLVLIAALFAGGGCWRAVRKGRRLRDHRQFYKLGRMIDELNVLRAEHERESRSRDS